MVKGNEVIICSTAHTSVLGYKQTSLVSSRHAFVGYCNNCLAWLGRHASQGLVSTCTQLVYGLSDSATLQGVRHSDVTLPFTGAMGALEKNPYGSD